VKNKLFSLNRLLLALPMLSLLIGSSKANSYQVVGNTDGATGAYNYAISGIGTYSYSSSNIGEYAYSANYIAGEFYSPSYIALYGVSGSGYSAYFAGGFQGSGSCYFAGGSGFNCTSDRNLKENFTAVNIKEILQRVSQLPITRWNMKGGKTNDQHIGPMAQDFHSAFAIGEDDKHINTADIQGVALAAIQGLYQVVQEKDVKIQKQEAEIAQLHKQMDAMNAQVTAKLNNLERAVQASNTPMRQHRIAVVQSKPGA